MISVKSTMLNNILIDRNKGLCNSTELDENKRQFEFAYLVLFFIVQVFQKLLIIRIIF